MAPRTARPSTARLAAADALTTAAFVLFSSLWGEAALRLAPAAGVSTFVAGLTVLGLGLAAFSPMTRGLAALAGTRAGPGPCFNPAHSLALAAAGKGIGGPLRSAAARAAAQAVGGVAGAAAAARLLPASLASTIPVPKILSLRSALIAESLLGAALALVVIWSVAEAAPGSWSAWGAPLAATLCFTWIGAELAGHHPSFNPAYALAWARRALASPGAQGALTHVAAFVLAPLVGAALAGGIWRVCEEPSDKGAKKKSRAAAAAASKARKAAAAAAAKNK